jgi:hypothetical protein
MELRILLRCSRTPKLYFVEGWIAWMRTQVKEANQVLLILTETY